MIGSAFGISPPESVKGKVISLAISGSLTMITASALKIFYHFSFCDGGYYTLKTFIRVAVVLFVIGNIYSLGVNYLLNKYVYVPSPEKKDCCHTKTDK
jgi:hypothetical protein